MVVCNEVLTAISMTQVEDLVIYNCEMKSSYLDRYHSNPILDFGDVDSSKPVHFYHRQSRFGQHLKQRVDEENFKQILQQKETRYSLKSKFQFLKNVLVINCSRQSFFVQQPFTIKNADFKFDPAVSLLSIDKPFEEYNKEAIYEYTTNDTLPCRTGLLNIEDRQNIR